MPAHADDAAVARARADGERIVENLVSQACAGLDGCDYRAEMRVARLDDDERPDLLISIPPQSCVAGTCEAHVYLAQAGGYRELTVVQGTELQPGEARSNGLLNLWSLLYIVGGEQAGERPRVVAQTPVDDHPAGPRMVMEVLEWSGTAYVPTGELRHDRLRLEPVDGLAHALPGAAVRARPDTDADVLVRYPASNAYLDILARWTGGPWLLVRLRQLEDQPIVGYVPADDTFDIEN